MHDRLDISMRANHVFFWILVIVALVFAAFASFSGDVFYLRLATIS